MSSRIHTKQIQKIFIYNDKILFLLGLLSSFVILQVGGISIFLLMTYGLLACGFITGIVRIDTRSNFLPFLAVVTISAIISLFLGLSDGYILNNIKGLINYYAIFVLATSITSGRSDGSYIHSLLDGLKWSCRIQVLWIIIQTFSWNFLKIDINKLIFVDIFKIVEKASQFKSTGYVPTGLCWNAGGIAPIIFLGFFLEDKLITKLAVVIGAVLTQSATLTIGITLCVTFMMLQYARNLESLINKRKKITSILFGLLLFLAFVVFLYQSSAFISQQVNRLWDVFSYRISGLLNETSSLDSSTSAHLGYFTNLSKVLLFGSIITFLFGYGINTSGFPYSAVTGQYSGQIWIVECDFVNILLNFGAIGLILFYLWFIKGIDNLRINDSKITVAFIIIALMGVTYNLQYIWLVFVELLLFSHKFSTTNNALQKHMSNNT